MSKTRKPCRRCGRIEYNQDCPICRYQQARLSYIHDLQEKCLERGEECEDTLTSKRGTLLPPHLQEIIRQARRAKRKKKQPRETQPLD